MRTGCSFFGGAKHRRGPGVREAVEENRWSDAEQYALIVAGVLGNHTDRLDRVTSLLANPPVQN